MPRRERALRALISAEHGGNDVPPPYRPLFRDREGLLASHRGWDPGTAELARALASALGAPCHVATVTRLLVDLNRSASNPAVFSEVTRVLPTAERAELIARHHTPHRERVEATAAALVAEGHDVLHLGVHSFTPVLRGVARRADLALLYDPVRARERALAAVWTARLREALPEFRIRRNHPYRGSSDGLTTTLRRRFPKDRYLGLEIEVSQALVGEDGVFPVWVARTLLDTLPERAVGS
jgi:predicted N-formylglutamate amidohydrolase